MRLGVKDVPTSGMIFLFLLLFLYSWEKLLQYLLVYLPNSILISLFNAVVDCLCDFFFSPAWSCVRKEIRQVSAVETPWDNLESKIDS